MTRNSIWWKTLRNMFRVGGGRTEDGTERAGSGRVIRETPPAEGQDRHMKILVMSDSHSRDENVRSVVDREAPFDALIHLGDSQEEEEEFASVVDGTSRSIWCGATATISPTCLRSGSSRWAATVFCWRTGIPIM